MGRYSEGCWWAREMGWQNIMKCSKGKCEKICIWDGITPCMQQYRLGTGLKRKQLKSNLRVLVDKSWPQVSSVACSPRPHFAALAKPQQVGESINPFCETTSAELSSLWGSPLQKRHRHTGGSKCNRSLGWPAGWSTQCLRRKKLGLKRKGRWEKSHYYMEHASGMV